MAMTGASAELISISAVFTRTLSVRSDDQTNAALPFFRNASAVKIRKGAMNSGTATFNNLSVASCNIPAKPSRIRTVRPTGSWLMPRSGIA